MSRLQLRSSPEANVEQFTTRLTDEFRHYDDPGQGYHQPLINIDQPGDRAHLLVIWDDWRMLSQVERSQIVLDAYTAALGAEAGSRVSVAMGLTQDEATRLGIDFVPPQA